MFSSFITLRRSHLALWLVMVVSLVPTRLIASTNDSVPELGRSSNNAETYPSLFALPASIDFDPQAQSLTISSLNLEWSVQLHPKNLLGGVAEIQQVLFDVPEFFEGSVAGDVNSWVRLNRHQRTDGITTDTPNASEKKAIFSGHLFTAGTLYALQYHEDRGGHTVAVVSETVESLPSLSTARNNRHSVLAPSAIKIGIAIDSRYNEYHNGRGLAHALGIINGVDGLYQNQLGLAVVVENFRVYDDADSDPLRRSDSLIEQLLADYREIRNEDSELPNDLALVHLFSGHGDPDKVIGLGWINSACREDGYDLSMSTPFPYDMLLAAHEIAHNLGAPHDNDTQCNSDTSITGTEIMWSELSGNTRSTFSSCSLNEMRDVFEASCVADNIDAGISLAAEPTSTAFEQRVQVSASNHDPSRHAALLTSVTTFPINTVLTQPSAGCTTNQTSLTCQHTTLAPGQTDTAFVTAAFAAIDNPVLSAELIVSEFIDTLQGNNRAALQLDANKVTSSISAMSQATASANPVLGDQSTLSAQGGSAGVGSVGPLSLGASGLFLAGLLRVRRHRQKLRSTE